MNNNEYYSKVNDKEFLKKKAQQWYTCSILIVVFCICAFFWIFENCSGRHNVGSMYMLTTIVGIGGGLFFLVNGRICTNLSKGIQETEDKLLEQGIIATQYLRHVDGLGVGDSMCNLELTKELLKITCGNMEFSIPIERISVAETKTDVDIQKFINVKNNVGGAIAGGLMFGALGAIIGGKPKTVTNEIASYTYYVIINYMDKSNNLACISFCNGADSSVRKFTDSISSMISSNKKKQIEL